MEIRVLCGFPKQGEERGKGGCIGVLSFPLKPSKREKTKSCCSGPNVCLGKQDKKLIEL